MNKIPSQPKANTPSNYPADEKTNSTWLKSLFSSGIESAEKLALKVKKILPTVRNDEARNWVAQTIPDNSRHVTGIKTEKYTEDFKSQQPESDRSLTVMCFRKYVKEFNEKQRNKSLGNDSGNGQPKILNDEKIASILNSNIGKLLGEINSDGSKKLTAKDALDISNILEYELEDWLANKLVDGDSELTIEEITAAIKANRRIIECAKSYANNSTSAGADS